MKVSNQRWLAALAIIASIVAIAQLRTSPSIAQPVAVAQDPAVALGNCIATRSVTIKVEKQKGEPRPFSGRAKFDRPVQAYWVALVGSDIKFEGNTEKYVNRQMVSVDPFAKLIDGTELEVSGKLGIRDGSGDWDDAYEGTITISVTALMSSR